MTPPTGQRLRGQVLRMGDDVNTDVLHPSCFYSLDRLTVRQGFGSGEPALSQQVAEAPDRTTWILAGGRNFGYGSSRETTIESLRLNGVLAVVARTVSRIFWRNAVNAGLWVFECPQLPEPEPAGAIWELDPETARILDAEGRPLADCLPLDAYDRTLLEAGGLLAWLRQGSPLRPGGQ